MINILTPDAQINDNAPEKYRGLDRYVARKAVLADLEAARPAGRREEAQAAGAARRPHRPGDRALPHRPVVREDGHAGRARPRAGRERQRALRARELDQHLSALDGRTSRTGASRRQLWWGHRIPAWYDADGKIYVGRDEAEVRASMRLGADVVADPRQRRARDLVLVGAVVAQHARLARCRRHGEVRASTSACRPRCWSPASTSSSSGSPG